MGYLLKEALKTLCGVNQWSYAVFWKIGCQNPKLLIWEECYYQNPETNFHDLNGPWVSTESRNLEAGDKVHLLVNRMMLNNHVNIVGEGLVGRVAFTGNHQWIASDNYYKESHPPEVLEEVGQQFLAGMKTVALIPVLPHGVVQLGSYLKIMENMGFVNDVVSLLSQLGDVHVPRVLLSENYGAKEPVQKIGAPICLGNSTPEELFGSNVMNASSVLNSFNCISSPAQTSMFNPQPSYSFFGQMQNNLQSVVAPFQASSSRTAHLKHQNYDHAVKMTIPVKLDPSEYHLMDGVAKAEVMPSNFDAWANQTSMYVPSSTVDVPSTCSADLIPGIVRCTEQKFTTPKNDPSLINHYMDEKFMETKLNSVKEKIEQTTTMARNNLVSQMQKSESRLSVNNTEYDDACVQHISGDDLFDILGADYKNKLFSSQWNGCSTNESSQNTLDCSKSSNISMKRSLEMYPNSQVNSDSGIFSLAVTDHLLDAIVSKVPPAAKQGFDDSVSCGTTLTNVSSSSAPCTSLPYSRFGVSEQMTNELYGVPKYLAKGVGMSSSALRTGTSKEDSGTCSPGSAIYGSQISSWIEKGQSTKQSNSVSTGCSKKPDETSKTNRKRLKPGENPRPRPKDRQMIQDRVKELREIVPNGAKCSIDALLERTIKHMLFLQSVTKHADKLKQAGESKIISKDGGLSKNNFEGGATWAYEVGSQSMVCPIIVEDLNQPRQMLVEMLCEERGLFLEIADIIRGLGLTILKGVMETQNDKIWARFTVEANREVTRMEIFISLVRLLEQSSKTGAAQPSNENMMAQQFHQSPSVPVNGVPHSLQRAT